MIGRLTFRWCRDERVERACGYGGPGYHPEHLWEVEAFVASQKPVSEGERLLRRFRKCARAQG